MILFKHFALLFNLRYKDLIIFTSKRGQCLFHFLNLIMIKPLWESHLHLNFCFSICIAIRYLVCL